MYRPGSSSWQNNSVQNYVRIVQGMLCLAFVGVDMQLENIVLVIYNDVMRHIILARAHKRPA